MNEHQDPRAADGLLFGNDIAAKKQFDHEKRVKQILKMAEQAATDEERETLVAKAFDIMQKYDIDEASLTVETGRTVDEEIVQRYVACTGIYNEALVSLGYAVAESLRGVQAIRSGTGTRSYIIFVGFKSKVQLVEVLHASLSLQMTGALKRNWKSIAPLMSYSTSMQKFKWKRSFGMGFASEVRHRFEMLRKDADTNVSASTALVLFDKDKLVEDYLKDKMDIVFKKKSLLHDNHAHMTGRQEGRKADLGQGGVTTGSHTALK